MSEKQADNAKIHWNRITPSRLLVVLLVVEVGLFFSEHWYPKGWAVLIATVCVSATTLYLLTRLAFAFLFHRPFQYSIRSMLIFMAIIALAGGWMAQRIRDAVKQRQAMGLEGRVIVTANDWPGLTLLIDVFGKNFFWDASDTTECDFFESEATDADLEYVKRFKRLRELTIRGNPAITDAGLERLKDLKQLNILRLIDTNITDAGLKQLESLDSLRELWLHNTKVTGTGLKHLAGLKQLHVLRFDKSVISDEGLNNIKKLTQIETLSLENAGITDARLNFLKGMNNLHTLVLSENDITDAGLPHLKELKQLEGLYLFYTNITDAGLKHLSGYDNLRAIGLLGTKVTDTGLNYLSIMTQLKEVDLYDTRTTIIGIKNLQKALPNTNIHF